MRRLTITFAAALVLCGCTPEQIGWFMTAPDEDKQAVNEHVIREAAAEFGVDPDLMVRIAECESGLHTMADNPRSDAMGLFQHLHRYWPGRAEAVGQGGASVFDPVANSRAAAWMIASGGTSPWNPSRGCWR